MEKIERQDIQGVLIYGYKYLPVAYYLFLCIDDRRKFQQWLKTTTIQDGASSPRSHALNIAFTSHGLKTLGVPVDEDNGFSRPFIEGMDTEHRNRILGDYGANASAKWAWGNKDDTSLHAVLMLFARDDQTLDQLYDEQQRLFADAGITETRPGIRSFLLEGGKEHFGFSDGVNQPVMRGLDRETTPDNYVNPGEFILGYRNEYNKDPNRPCLVKEGVDLGFNGSYMVFRQIDQHVALFWDVVCGYFGGADTGREKGIELAAKMTGRWPNGNPLTKKHSDKVPSNELNDFSFYRDDQHGMACPLGSHIRRTNPRDSLSINDREASLKEAVLAANKHRILRRGRPYGKPLVDSMAIDDMLDNLVDDGESRGLNFICFNSDIDRQFEFVQHTWANNLKFHNLYNDVDPVMGVQNGGRDENNEYTIAKTQFEVQADPVRRRYGDIPPFVQVKGGSYFFLPGLRALAYLAESGLNNQTDD